MYAKFKDWANANKTEVTWFLIGSLISSMFDAFGRGEYLWAAFMGVMAILNYYTRNVDF